MALRMRSQDGRGTVKLDAKIIVIDVAGDSVRWRYPYIRLLGRSEFWGSSGLLPSRLSFLILPKQ